jgi:serine/threonine protein kinase
MTLPFPSNFTNPGEGPGGAESTRDETLIGKSGPVPAGSAAVPSLPDSSAPRFRILRAHARGGLGQIFVALDSEMQREVALKEIQLSHAGHPDSQARFLLEAEVTGRLEHPGIVPVYGRGQYPDGRPFYAMRFIRGESLEEVIHRFHQSGPAKQPGATSPAPCAEPAPGLIFRELLGRVIAVCQTIAYAHSRGVVHRDIKPANIMLGEYGETLVVDWGLAKILGQTTEIPSGSAPSIKLSSSSIVSPTILGSAMGTPSYMSPEQAAGKLDAIGPASDVYSLGATLYCVLTGKPPVRGYGQPTITDKDQVVIPLAEDILPPIAINSDVPPALSAICVKAMSHEPKDRYPSATALAEDINRWLADEPVSAYPEPRMARLMRWARRHRSLVGSSAALLAMAVLALGIGSLLIWREQRRTDEHRRQAQKNLELALDSVNAMMAEVSEKDLANDPRLEQKRHNVLEKARRCYQDFLGQQGNDSDLGKAVALAHKRLADIERMLGRNGEAEAAYRQAITLLEERLDRPGAHDDQRELRENLAESYNHLGEVLRASSKPKEAGQAYHHALELQQRLAHDFPGEAEYRRLQAQSHDNLCILYRQTDRGADALTESDLALAILKPLANRDNARREDRRQLALAWLNRGTLLHDAKQHEQAASSYRACIKILEVLAAGDRDRPDRRYELAAAWINLGITERARRDYPAARRAQARAHELLDALVRDFPRIPKYQADLAHCGNSLGALEDSIRSDEFLSGTANVVFDGSWQVRLAGCAQLSLSEATGGRALKYWQDAREQLDRLMKDQPSIDYRARRGRVLLHLARLHLQRQRAGDLAAARKLLQLSAIDLKAATQAEPNNGFFRQLLEYQRKQEAALASCPE